MDRTGFTRPLFAPGCSRVLGSACATESTAPTIAIAIHHPRSRGVRCLNVGAVASNPKVLVIGLDPYRVPGPWDPAPVADAIEASTASFAERGIDVENCLLGLDGEDDIDAVVTAALRAQSWACVVVGGGVRKSEELLELFERIVNLAHRHAPDAAIAFNRTPADTVDAAARWLG